MDLNPSVNYRDPEYFPQPDNHIPERWLRKDGDHKKHLKNLKLDNVDSIDKLIEAAENVHPFILTPFGHGTRMCAGRRYRTSDSFLFKYHMFVFALRFAEQHIHVMLATLLRHFRLDYPVDKSMGAVYHTLLFPDRAVRVKFLPRSQ